MYTIATVIVMKYAEQECMLYKERTDPKGPEFLSLIPPDHRCTRERPPHMSEG